MTPSHIFNDDQFPLTITELTGDQRVLRLEGRALPYRDIEWSGEQRTDKTLYPGNPTATMQVFGPEEKETAFNGIWKDRFLGNTDPTAPAPATLDGNALTDAVSLAEVADDFRRKGQLVEVQWGPYLRRGIMTKFKSKTLKDYGSVRDLGWEMEFDWINQGDPATPPLVNGVDWASLNSKLGARVDDMTNTVQAPPTPLDPGVSGSLAGTVASLQQQAAAMSSSVSLLADQTYTLPDIAGSAVSSLLIVKGLAGQVIDGLDSLAVTVMALFDLVPGAQPTLGQTLASALYQRTTIDSARQMQWFAAQNASDVQQQSDASPLLAVYVARAGDDLRGLSSLYYGVPDHWRDILVFNGLASSSLDVGQIVYIPALTSGVSVRAS